MKHTYPVWILFLLLFYGAQAQKAPFDPIQKNFSDYASRTFQEKLFVHLDRPLYVVGETLWFKAYCVEAGGHVPLDISKIAYLDILDKEQNSVAQTQITLAKGQGDGSLAIPATLASGTYTVRSYTNWMKNFGADFYFETSVTILNPFLKPETSSVQAQSSPAYDLQFFPEGGHLVSQLENRVAFRAIDKEGKGLDFQGFIVNQQNDTLLRFQPRRFGIGTFSLKPENGSEYRAVLRDKTGATFTYPMPTAQSQGYAMLVRDSTDRLLTVTVSAHSTIPAASEVFLLAHTRLGSIHSEARAIRNGQAVFVLDKYALGEGITHLTVFNSNRQPVCERLYFKRPTGRLAIRAVADKNEYPTRDKVHLDLTASAASALPASLSVSVYLLDSLPQSEATTIENYLWLTSDLKGTVESPDYYTQAVGPEADEALDNLMLTHGWSRFRWDTILTGTQPTFAYLPEYEGHFVKGRVLSTLTNQPVGRISAFLATPGLKARLFLAQSDSLGNLRFEVKKLFDRQEVIIQTNTRQDSTYRIEISSPYSEQVSSRRWPQGLYRPQQGSQLLTRSINMQTLNSFMLRPSPQAVYTGTDTLAFFGKPSERYFLDAFTRFPTMEEVMREYVPGVFVRKRQGDFRFLVVDRVTPQGGIFNQDPLILLDGIPVFNTNKIMEFDPLKVQKLEVVDALYYLGHLSFSGIVSYTTYKGDLGGFPLDPRALVVSYQFAQSHREFYAPRYDTPLSRESRLPDFRNLLHWSPTLVPNAQGKVGVDFYTSDQTGTYRVVVQGLTAGGEAGSGAFTFEVKPGARQ